MVILVIIGALIGAGFASGQEIYLFFFRYGKSGIIGLFFCSTLISIIIYKTLKIIYKKNINNYEEFLEEILNKKNKILIYSINIIINIFLLISFFIMISGFGAYFYQEYKINNFIGSSVLAFFCFLIFIKNIKGVAKINSIIVPILIFLIIFIGIKNINLINLNNLKINIKQNIFNNWFFKSILYGSYNIILLIPILINLKKYIKNKKSIKIISIFSGLIIFLLAINIIFILLKLNINYEKIEMPAVYVISQDSNFLRNIYGIIISLSIFTTAISTGISFLKNNIKNKKYFPQFAALMCITSVLISNIGFSNLVKNLFPLFGFLGLIQIYYILKK